MTTKFPCKHREAVIQWIEEQDEPEIYWMSLKVVMRRDFRGFTSWLKKRNQRRRATEEKGKVLEFNQTVNSPFDDMED